MDATKWADTVGLMHIGSQYGLTVNSSEADFRRAAEQAVRDAKDQQGANLSNASDLASAFKRAFADRKSW